MSTHRQLPPNTDIAPWQDKGRWYRIFGEKTADGVTISQSDIAGVTGAIDSDGNTSIQIPGQVNGKNFHLVNAVSDVSSGTGTSGTGFTYPQIGVTYGADNSYNYVLNSKKTPEESGILITSQSWTGTAHGSGSSSTTLKKAFQTFADDFGSNNFDTDKFFAYGTYTINFNLIIPEISTSAQHIILSYPFTLYYLKNSSNNHANVESYHYYYTDGYIYVFGVSPVVSDPNTSVSVNNSSLRVYQKTDSNISLLTISDNIADLKVTGLLSVTNKCYYIISNS